MGNECEHPRVDVLLDRAAPQGNTRSPERSAAGVTPSALCPGHDAGSRLTTLGGSQATAAGEGACSSRAYNVMAEEHARGLGQENLKRSTLDLQICAHGLDILALKPTANLLLPASATAAQAAPYPGQGLSTTGWVTRSSATASRAVM